MHMDYPQAPQGYEFKISRYITRKGKRIYKPNGGFYKFLVKIQQNQICSLQKVYVSIFKKSGRDGQKFHKIEWDFFISQRTF